MAGESNPGILMRETYFPTFIYFRDLAEGPSINQALTPHIYAWREEDREGIVRSNVRGLGVWHSQTNAERRPEFASLVQCVERMTGEIFEDLGYHPDGKPRLDGMWANIAPRYGFNRSHTHPACLWSGVYYVQAPEGSGRIFFTDPRPQAHVLGAAYGRASEKRPESWSEVYFKPVAGRMILFPAWLAHEVEPNMSKVKGAPGDRISISFNIIQVRDTA